MKKKNISPEKAKLISTLLVSFTFMAIVLTISSLYTRRMLDNAKADYFATIETTLEGFEKIVSLQLHEYKNYLRAYQIDIERSVKNYDPQKIFEFLKSYNDTRHPDFLDFYYMTPDGTAYLSDGTIAQMTPKNHPGITGQSEYYISEIYIPPKSNQYVFGIEKPLVHNNEVTGVLGISVIASKFKERTTGYKIGNRESFMLLDQKGVFVIHPRNEIIGLKYTPTDKRFENTGTERILLLCLIPLILRQVRRSHSFS